MGRCGAQPGGFTLIELVMVMMVITIVLALAAPSLQFVSRSSKADDIAAQLVALCHWARAQAIIDGRVYRLLVDERENAFRLEMQEEDQFVDLGTEFGRTFVMPEETQIALRPWTAAATVASRARTGSAAMLGGTAAASARNETALQFYPNGRGDLGVIIVTDALGRSIRLGNPSPAEPMRVLEEGEEQLE